MHIEKSFAVAAPREQVWQFITSPEQVGPCMPGCQHVEVTGAGTYRAAISVKVETVAERPPEFPVFSVKGEEGANSSRVEALPRLRRGNHAAEDLRRLCGAALADDGGVALAAALRGV